MDTRSRNKESKTSINSNDDVGLQLLSNCTFSDETMNMLMKLIANKNYHFSNRPDLTSSNPVIVHNDKLFLDESNSAMKDLQHYLHNGKINKTTKGSISQTNKADCIDKMIPHSHKLNSKINDRLENIFYKDTNVASITWFRQYIGDNLKNIFPIGEKNIEQYGTALQCYRDIILQIRETITLPHTDPGETGVTTKIPKICAGVTKIWFAPTTNNSKNTAAMNYSTSQAMTSDKHAKKCIQLVQKGTAKILVQRAGDVIKFPTGLAHSVITVFDTNALENNPDRISVMIGNYNATSNNQYKSRIISQRGVLKQFCSNPKRKIKELKQLVVGKRKTNPTYTEDSIIFNKNVLQISKYQQMASNMNDNNKRKRIFKASLSSRFTKRCKQPLFSFLSFYFTNIFFSCIISKYS